MHDSVVESQSRRVWKRESVGSLVRADSIGARRNLHGFLDAMLVFCRRVVRRRVHACALLSRRRTKTARRGRKFSGDNAWPGCRYRHRREPQEYPVSFGRMCILRPTTIHAHNLVNLARARFAPLRLSNLYGFGSHARPSSLYFSQEVFSSFFFPPPTIYQKVYLII